MNNIAILIPTYNNSLVLQQCLNYLHRLNPQPKYYIILENNCVDDTVNTIATWKEKYPNTIDIHLTFEEETIKSLLTKNPYNIIGIARQTLLDTARELSVDYAIYLDDDIFIVDRNFVDIITGFNKDIVGGAYFREYPSGKLLSYLIENKGKNKDTRPYLLRNYIKKKLMKVIAVGGGCMCISKKVLMDKRVNFYPITEYYLNQKASSEDFGYCILAGNYGYAVYTYDGFRICHYQIHEARAWREKND